MGSRKPGRDMRWGSPTDALRLYARHYRIYVECRKPGCGNRRELLYAFLERLFEPDTALGMIADRFRCARCGLRGGRVKTEYIGPTEVR